MSKKYIKVSGQRIEQVLFDCDGVLVDTEFTAAEVMTDVLRKYDIDISISDYLKTFTGDTFSNIMKVLVPSLKNLKELGNSIEVEIYGRLKAVAGMADLVKNSTLPAAVVSNSKIWQVEKAIRFLQLEQYLSGKYFSSEMVDNPKPSPDIYLHAAKTLNKDPRQCLVVEDSLSGAKAALEANMNVIGFTGASHILAGHDTLLLNLGVAAIAANAEDLKQLIHYNLT